MSAAPSSSTVPGGCYWVPDHNGALMLIPGCMARVMDPDAECTCDTLAARLAVVEEQLREEREAARYAQEWYAAVADALNEHPAGLEIRTDARRRADR